jgi:hypothetical protein
MRRLFAALDVDYDQWLALTKTALRVDLRASAFMRAQTGPQTRAAAAIIGQLAFYTIMGGFVAVFVWFSRDLFLSATSMLTYIMFMVGTAALLDHNAAITSPDDHAILGFRPVTSRTYFAARLANVLVYTTVLTTLFAYLPVASYFIRWGAGIGLASLVAVYAASTAVALTMVVAYASLLRLIGPARIRRVLSYVQFIFSFFVYGGYFVLMRLVSESALAGFTLDKTIWMLLLPPAWFASYLEIAAGRVSLMELIPAAVSIGALVMLGVALGGRLSLDYAERLAALATGARAASTRPARARRAWWFTTGEARAVALLIRSQFANDMKFRMGVLAILPLTVIYLLMGISDEGTVGDPFVQGRSAQALQMVTLAMLMFPTMLKMNLGRSDAFRASWIFFACPMDRTRMVRAAKNVLVAVFLLPYLLVVGVVLVFLTTNVWHLAVHLLVVGLMSHLVLQVVTFIEPELPFSKPLQKGRSSTRVFMLMAVIAVGAIVLPILAPLIYGNAWAIAATFTALIGASVLIERFTRLRVEAQAERLEFEG